MWKKWVGGLLVAAMMTPAAACLAEGAPAVDPGYKLLAPLYAQVGGGFAYSPLGLRLAMDMALEGARGETRAQIIAALSGDEAALEQTAALSQLRQANAAIVSPTAMIRPEYEAALREKHNAAIMPMEDDMMTQVNNWAKQHTDGMIEELLSEAPDPNIALMLLNALTFEADWLYPFEPMNTHDSIFHAPSGALSVPFMGMTSRLDYAKAGSAQAIRLAYDEEELEMVLILPDEGTLAEVVAQISAEGLGALGNFTAEGTVNLALPKMNLESQLTLNEVLRAVGIVDAFSQSADFTGISEAQDLMIDQVLQKVRIDVDEKGTKAAAATAIAIMPKSAMIFDPIMMHFDRPFIMLIRDAQNGTLAFAAVVEQP